VLAAESNLYAFAHVPPIQASGMHNTSKATEHCLVLRRPGRPERLEGGFTVEMEQQALVSRVAGVHDTDGRRFYRLAHHACQLCKA
jgi:hypothetical protein